MRENMGELDKRATAIKSLYGITIGEYIKIWEDQGKVCKICEKPLIPCKCSLFPDTEVACVDHDHITKEVKGLLCSSCNIGLGKLQEDKFTVEKAAQYLVDTDKISKKTFVNNGLFK